MEGKDELGGTKYTWTSADKTVALEEEVLGEYERRLLELSNEEAKVKGEKVVVV